jgi:hypothetical protein
MFGRSRKTIVFWIRYQREEEEVWWGMQSCWKSECIVAGVGFSSEKIAEALVGLVFFEH